MWVLGLLACQNPITNAVFYEDEAFLSALPSADRVGFSSHFAGLAPGPDADPLLLHALAEAEALDPLLSLTTGVADVLRSTTPAERSSTHRSWSARALAAPPDAAVDTWWIRADIVRADEVSDAIWTVEGAPGADGPWGELGRGRQEPGGAASYVWDLALTGDLLGQDLGVEMDVELAQDDGDPARREVSVRFPASLAIPREYALQGREGFGWTGWLDLGGSGPEPGVGQVILLADHSGRGQAIVLRDEGEVGWGSCWLADGRTSWAQGDAEDLPAGGDPSTCTVPDVFAP